MKRNRFVVTRVAEWVAVLLTSAGLALGQAPAAKPAQSNLNFEVATIKLAPPLDMMKVAQQVQAGQMPKIGPHIEGSLAEYNYMTLQDMISIAYKVKPYQVSGPAWMTPAATAQRFDIVARMPAGATKDDAPAMLQTLLKERFQVKAHLETQEHPVLALIVSKGGPKLKAATEVPVAIDESKPLKPGEMKMDTPDGPVRVMVHPDGSSEVNMGAKGTITRKIDVQTKTMHIDSNAATMSGFADMLTQVMQMGGTSSRQVVDMTELKGYYQVSLEVSILQLMAMARSAGMDIPMPTDAQAAELGGGPSIFESVGALGLKLDSRKAPIEQLVIDNAEKAPTEN